MEFIEYLSTIRTDGLNVFFQLVTYFGEELFVVAVLCICYWCINKERAYKLAISYFFAGLCIQVLKVTYRIPRPWVRNPEFKPVESAVEAATGYSFPSGHTQGATTLGVSIMCGAKKKWQLAAAVLLILLVGFSRMYLGVHTPADVLVSFGVSAVITYLVHRFYDTWFHEDNVEKNAVILALLPILVILYASYLVQSGVISVELAEDCYKVGGAGLGFAVGYYLEKRYVCFNVQEHGIGMHVFKVVLGLAGAMIIKSGPKWILGETVIVNVVRYFFVVVWILAVYPYIWQKLRNKYLET